MPPSRCRVTTSNRWSPATPHDEGIPAAHRRRDRLAEAAADRSRLGMAAQSMRSGMLYWSFVFLAIALVAALVGFGGIAEVAVEIARVIFFVFIIVFVITLFFGLFRRGPR